MMGWMIVRDGAYFSPSGYVAKPQHAQWFRSEGDARQGLADIRRDNFGLARGADVKEVKIPGDGFGSAMGAMEADYNPWWLAR
jgi:hypothetical protein